VPQLSSNFFFRESSAKIPGIANFEVE
jgi:hypothetical protein